MWIHSIPIVPHDGTQPVQTWTIIIHIARSQKIGGIDT